MPINIMWVFLVFTGHNYLIQVSIDLFLMGHQFQDVASLGPLSRNSAGACYRYPGTFYSWEIIFSSIFPFCYEIKILPRLQVFINMLTQWSVTNFGRIFIGISREKLDSKPWCVCERQGAFQSTHFTETFSSDPQIYSIWPVYRLIWGKFSFFCPVVIKS